jgi:predicted AlkP superfamily phosphohydrolase/phosphomutase
VFALTVGITLTFFITHRPFRFAPLWGAVWAWVFGFWLLVPLMLDVHHMPPLSIRQWAILYGPSIVGLALGGAALATVTALPLAIWSVARRRGFRNPAWAYSIYAALSLPVAYLLLSWLVEWSTFSRSPSVEAYGPMLAGTGVVLALALIAFYNRTVANGRDERGRSLAALLVGVAMLGLLIVPARRTTPPDDFRPAQPLGRRSSARTAPLLVVGLDGGNWRTLQPLIDAGRLPTFSRLAADGVQGRVEALWPPFWSTPAWGSILTGYSQDEVGVHEDLTATADGFPLFELPLTLNLALNPLFAVEFGLIGLDVIEPMPMPRNALNRVPIWERLSRAGAKTAVVRFPFTYPAGGQADYVVSNRVVVDLWDRVGVEPGVREHLVGPRVVVDEVLALFAAGEPPTSMSDLIVREDWPKPNDALEDPVAVLRTVQDLDSRMHRAAIRLLQRDQGLSVLMIHVTGFDSVCHAFWPYRFPEDFPEDPPNAADVAQLGPVVDRYLERLDRQLAELIAAFPSPPNVLIVSDHGAGPSRSYPAWRGWHDTPGMFLAAGPDVPKGTTRADVAYYDIVPTILDLQNFHPDTDLRGRSATRPAPAP